MQRGIGGLGEDKDWVEFCAVMGGPGESFVGVTDEVGFLSTMDKYRSLTVLTGDGCSGVDVDVPSGRMNFILFLLIPAPKIRWSWRGMESSSCPSFMLRKVVVTCEVWRGSGGQDSPK